MDHPFSTPRRRSLTLASGCRSLSANLRGHPGCEIPTWSPSSTSSQPSWTGQEMPPELPPRIPSRHRGSAAPSCPSSPGPMSRMAGLRFFGSRTFHEVTNYYPTRYLRTARYKYHRNIAWKLDFPSPPTSHASLSWEGIRNSKSPVTIGERPLEAYVRRPPEELYDMQEEPERGCQLGRASGVQGAPARVQERAGGMAAINPGCVVGEGRRVAVRDAGAHRRRAEHSGPVRFRHVGTGKPAMIRLIALCAARSMRRKDQE